MAYQNEYPSVDPYRYNDNWLLETVDRIQREWEAKYPEWEARLDHQDELIAEIKKQLDEIVQLSPGFMEQLIAGAIKNVWFGINKSGYFVAYVPESWRSIQFATTGYDTAVPTQLEYGHLCLYENQETYPEYKRGVCKE